jgi:Rieske Fe-S protein
MSEQLSRRSALRGTLIAVVGGVAGFAIARNSAAAKQPAGTTAANAYGAEPSSSGGGQALATVAAIPREGGRILQHPAVVVVRTASDEIHAYSAICTHQGCAVTQVAGGTIDCPCHGSKFDVNTGKVVAGPAPRPLPPIAVVVRNGQVFSS